MKRRRAKSTSDSEPSALSGLAAMHVEYDEARTAEERDTYHQPRLVAQGEFFADVHPLRKLRSRLRRTKRAG
jgi:hypothetical protein